MPRTQRSRSAHCPRRESLRRALSRSPSCHRAPEASVPAFHRNRSPQPRSVRPPSRQLQRENSLGRRGSGSERLSNLFRRSVKLGSNLQLPGHSIGSRLPRCRLSLQQRSRSGHCRHYPRWETKRSPTTSRPSVPPVSDRHRCYRDSDRQPKRHSLRRRRPCPGSSPTMGGSDLARSSMKCRRNARSKYCSDLK